MNDLSETLYRLLFHRGFREKFLRGGPEAIEALPATRGSLRTIDLAELEAAAKRIHANLLHGNQSDEGGLLKAFPRTFEALEGMAVNRGDLTYDFMESECFRAYREVPYGGIGITVEEAFQSFVSELPASAGGTERIRSLSRHEFLGVAFSILCLNRNLSQRLDSVDLRRSGPCEFSVESFAGAHLGKEGGQVTYLYAATPKGFVRGVVPESVARALRQGPLGPNTLERLGTWGEKLAQLGFTEKS